MCVAVIEAIFGDDAVPRKADAEQFRGKLDQLTRGRGFVASEGGAGADAGVAARLEVELGT
jgi:hypothetical protein